MKLSTTRNAEKTKLKLRPERSAVFTPLQRAGDLGEMLSAGIRTVKRTEVRAPVPFFALSAFSAVKSR